MVIGSGPQISCEHSLAFGLCAFLIRLRERDKDRINLGQYLRVAEVQTPTLLRLIVMEEDADLLDGRLVAIALGSDTTINPSMSKACRWLTS
jgi:hypothetical protein